MATDDKQVLVTGQAPTPATFKIPGNGQLQPKAVYASFDGSGSAGDFQPALKIFSDAGEVVGVYPTDSTVTAGGSVDVSWGPFLGRGGGGATATTLAFARAYLDGIILGGDPFQTVPAGSNVNGQFPHALTTDAAVMDWRTSSVTNDTLDLKAVGTYLVYVTTHFDIVSLSLASISLNAGQDGFPHTPWEPEKSPRFGDNIGTADNMDMNVLHVVNPTHSINVTHSNRLGADHSVEQCYFSVVYLGTG